MNRKTAAWTSALLIILQMVTGPVAHPMPGPPVTQDREPATYTGTAHSQDECLDGATAPDHSSTGSQHDQPAKHSGCQCTCPCGHTPALAMPTLSVARPALPEVVAVEPRGPAFTPPLYDFLRPPN